jgi:hypothetical protein
MILQSMVQIVLNIMLQLGSVLGSAEMVKVLSMLTLVSACSAEMVKVLSMLTLVSAFVHVNAHVSMIYLV